MLSNPTIGPLVSRIGLSGLIADGATTGNAGVVTSGCAFVSPFGGDGDGGNGGCGSKMIFVNRIGTTRVSVATTGTMIAAAMIRVCVTMDTRTVYFCLPPRVTNGSANILSDTAALLGDARTRVIVLEGLDTSNCEMGVMIRIAERGV